MSNLVRNSRRIPRAPRTLAHWMLLAALLAPACSGADSASLHFDSIHVTLKEKEKPFTLEVADTQAKRALGLMNRPSMPADHGMLFVFDQPDNYGFWMKNTKIALDLIFLDEAGKVLGIHALKPDDEHIVESQKPAKFALELNAGTAKTLALNVGDVLALPEKLLKATPRPDEK